MVIQGSELPPYKRTLCMLQLNFEVGRHSKKNKQIKKFKNRRICIYEFDMCGLKICFKTTSLSILKVISKKGLQMQRFTYVSLIMCVSK